MAFSSTPPTSASFQQFREDFAFFPDRREALVQTLTAGTVEHFLYSAQVLLLQLQATASRGSSTPPAAEQIEAIQNLLNQAQATFSASSSAFQSEATSLAFQEHAVLSNQLAILAFPNKPDLLLEKLDPQRRLRAMMATHSAPAAQSGSSKADTVVAADNEHRTLPTLQSLLPTRLDQDLVDSQKILARILKAIREESHQYPIPVPSYGWAYLFAHPEFEAVLDSININKLLQLFQYMELWFSPQSLEIINQADAAQGNRLIAKVVLKLFEAGRISLQEDKLRQLTTAQLELMRDLQPKLMESEAFVGLLEMRIVPKFESSATNPTTKDENYKQWLERMKAMVMDLSEKFMVHKCAVLLLELENDLSKGTLSKEKFLGYMSIPRQAPYVKPAPAFNNNVPGVRQPVVSLNERSLTYWSGRISPASADRDRVVVEEYLNHFLTLQESYEGFEQYFDLDRFLKPTLARIMLTKGTADTAKWIPFLGASASSPFSLATERLAELTNATLLKFSRNNPSTFLPSDPVIFRLQAKNAPRILVRVFEIKTIEYLQLHGQTLSNQRRDGGAATIGKELSLDGLLPNWERTLTFEDRLPIEQFDVTIELPELANRRGAFVMDVIANGENCCAYFSKGYLDFVSKPSVAGHVLTILDEKQEQISDDVTVWLHGHPYRPNADDEVIIPYRKVGSNVGSDDELLIECQGFATQRPFHHAQEEYEIVLSGYLDRESIVAGNVAKAILKPVLSIREPAVMCQVGLLENVMLTVHSRDQDGTLSTTTQTDFKIDDLSWSEYNFQVPENLQSISFEISARVKVMATGEYQDVMASKSFDFDVPDSDRVVSVEHDERKESIQLQGEVITVLQSLGTSSSAPTTSVSATVPEYQIMVLGKNGEARPETPLQFVINHPFWSNPLTTTLCSNSRGIIELGPLVDVESVSCQTTGLTWQIARRNKCIYPSTIHGIVGEPVMVPLVSREDKGFIRSVSLFSLTAAHGTMNQCTLEDMTSMIKLENGLLVMRGLAAGYYTLRLSVDVKIDILVASSSSQGGIGPDGSRILGLEDFHLSTSPMVELLNSASHPLNMAPPVITTEVIAEKDGSFREQSTVNIQLNHWTDDTRICIVASRFLPSTSLLEALNVVEMEQPWKMRRNELVPTFFSSGRVLGEEHQYILNRKTLDVNWAGNLLTKPSVLMNPHSVGETRMGTQSMASEDRSNEQAFAQQQYQAQSQPQMMNSRMAPRMAMVSQMSYRSSNYGSVQNRNPSLLSFLKNSSIVLANLRPNSEDGRLQIPVAAFKECNYLQLFAADGHQSLQRFMVLPRRSAAVYEKKDLRFKTPLLHTLHYSMEKSGTTLRPILQPSRISAEGVLQQPQLTAGTLELASNGSSYSSSLRVINSIPQVFDLMSTLLKAGEHQTVLKRFSFIVGWNKLSANAKKDLFSKWNCHELNLFLFEKDRPFFDAVVGPLLKNKIVKSFVDNYLIQADLSPYCSLVEFERLSCLEKCLLARRISNMRPIVARWLSDRVPRMSTARNAKLFETVMSAGKLSEVSDFLNADGDGGESSDGVVLESDEESDEDEVEKDDEDFEMIDPADFAKSKKKKAVQVAKDVQEVEEVEVVKEVEVVEEVIETVTTSAFGGLGGVSRVGGGLFGAAPSSSSPLFASTSPGYSPASPSYSPTSPTSGMDRERSRSRGGFSFGAGAPPPPPPAMSAPVAPTTSLFGGPTPPGSSAFGQLAPAGGLGFGSSFRKRVVSPESARLASAQVAKKQFVQVDLTKEMAETYYYYDEKLTWNFGRSAWENQKPNLFWVDYVNFEHESGTKNEAGGFLSQNFILNASTFTEALATLALMDIQFKPAEVSIRRTEDQRLLISSLSPAVVFHSSVKEVETNVKTPLMGSVLVMQKYFARDEKMVYDDQLKDHVRKYLLTSSNSLSTTDDKFEPLKSYGAHIVLMNSTSNPLNLFLDLQLPQGAISVNGRLENVQDVQLPAHGTFQYEYCFYFPEEGQFPHYPAHVSNKDSIVAFAEPTLLKVQKPIVGIEQITKDENSWSYVLNQGSQARILEKLDSSPMESVPIEKLVPRLYRDPDFYIQVVQLLQKRQEYQSRIWSVSMKHATSTSDEVNKTIFAEYLARQEIATQSGGWFTSPLLNVRPSDRSRHSTVDYSRGRGARGNGSGKTNDVYDFEYFEYFPLINERAHRATKKAAILNDRFAAQYAKFLVLLSQKPVLEVQDLLVLIVYLLAQDRVAEAKTRFSELQVIFSALDSELLSSSPSSDMFRLQYDYLRVYLELCVEVRINNSGGEASSRASRFEQEQYHALEAGESLDLNEIQTILKKYKGYPVQKWRKMFEEMQRYVDEIQYAEEAYSAGSGDVASSSASTALSAANVTISASEDGSADVAAAGSVEEDDGDDDDDEEGEEDQDWEGPQGTVVVDFKIEGSTVHVRHAGVKEITVEYYVIDAEVMFSASPFTFTDQGEDNFSSSTSGGKKQSSGNSSSIGGARDKSNSYRLVKPNGTETHTIAVQPSRSMVVGKKGKKPSNKGDHSNNTSLLIVPILAKFATQNCMISVTAKPSPPSANRVWKAYYSRSLEVQVLDQTGTIRVNVSKGTTTTATTGHQESNNNNSNHGRPIRAAYVKVYAEMKNSEQNMFWKDGYTDLVGRFEYAQVSAGDAKSLKDVKRFAVFVDGHRYGCLVRSLPTVPV